MTAIATPTTKTAGAASSRPGLPPLLVTIAAQPGTEQAAIEIENLVLDWWEHFAGGHAPYTVQIVLDTPTEARVFIDVHAHRGADAYQHVFEVEVEAPRRDRG